jgi:hypothetical protein
MAKHRLFLQLKAKFRFWGIAVAVVFFKTVLIKDKLAQGDAT